jgi:hypothetical protein
MLGVASVLVGTLISLAMLAQETVSAKRGDADLQNGGRLYRTYCQQCHGSEGDDILCIEMVPLAGLGRRPRAYLVGQVLSRSYFFRGRSYEGADARDLAAFLLSLKGEKGFDDPGLRCKPRLLSMRCDSPDDYRVIDIRDAAAYAQGHVPNAERWPTGEKGSEGQRRTTDVVRRKLGLLGVQPRMSIIIYDDTVTPAAADLWWDLVRAGHQNVAILDGGFRVYVEEGNRVMTVVTPLVSTAYVSSEVTPLLTVRAEQDYPILHLRAGSPQPSPGVFDWERTVADGQLRTGDEIRGYLKSTGIRLPGVYRVDGSDAEASFLVYLLRLLGDNGAYYDPVSKELMIDNADLSVQASQTP